MGGTRTQQSSNIERGTGWPAVCIGSLAASASLASRSWTERGLGATGLCSLVPPASARTRHRSYEYDLFKTVWSRLGWQFEEREADSWDGMLGGLVLPLNDSKRCACARVHRWRLRVGRLGEPSALGRQATLTQGACAAAERAPQATLRRPPSPWTTTPLPPRSPTRLCVRQRLSWAQ